MTHDVTILHPVAALATAIAIIAIFLCGRRAVIVPLFLTAILIPMQQRIVVFGFDFYLLRVLLFFGVIRLLIRSEFFSEKLNAIDKTFILYVMAAVLTYTLLHQNTGAFINRLGFAFTAFGSYFLLRSLIRDFEDIELLIKLLLLIALLLSLCMLIEKKTGRNFFSVFGGVPSITEIRDGRLRCQGPFSHPIMAGTFGASTLPLFVYLWWRETGRKALAAIGISAATIITITSSSSGPVLTYSSAVLGLLLWRFRNHMRAITWGFLFSLISLHLVMKAPVWALIGRVRIFSASTGYHRFMLIDEFINRFSEWWLIGTKSLAHWGHVGLYLGDVTNQYVRVAVDGGLITLMLFTAIIILCFRSIARALQAWHAELDKQKCCWSLSAILFAHCVTFMGVSYFDQMVFLWYVLLAIIGSASTLSENKMKNESSKAGT